jgi:acetyl-CoA synthetase
MRNVLVLRNLLTALDRDKLEWKTWSQAGRVGSEIYPLYTAEGGPAGPATAFLVRFGPNSNGDLHEHTGYELMFVLEGELRNDNGDRYVVGDLIIEEPQSVHQVSSAEGCVLLVVREGPTIPVTAPQPELTANSTL